MSIQIPGDDARVYHLHIFDAVTAKLVGTQKVKGNTSVNMSSLGIDIPQGIYIIRVEGLSQLAKILILLC
jgi:hypothetical protein